MGEAGRNSKEQIFREVEEAFGQIPTWMKSVPEVGLAGLWSTFRDFYLAETKIPNRYKELIGIAVSGATRCRYCTLFHTEAARLHGATDEEIAEASLMGSFTMMASTYLNAQQVDYDQFRNETLAIVSHVRRKQKGAEKQGRAEAGAHA